MIREYPNGATPISKPNRPTSEYIGRKEGTWRSETSQYPEEKKKTMLTYMQDLRRGQAPNCG